MTCIPNCLGSHVSQVENVYIVPPDQPDSDELSELRRRVADLERRVADLERRPYYPCTPAPASPQWPHYQPAPYLHRPYATW